MRPCTNGPRSLTRTVTALPLSSLVTRAKLGSGSVLCAAVTATGANASPVVVAELDLTLGLAGHMSVDELTPEALATVE